MKGMRAIYRRELAYYFSSWMGYIILAAFVIFMGFITYNAVLESKSADMRLFFRMIPFVFLFFGPAIAMRLVAEERKLGSLEILLTLPVSDWEVIFGKFLAAATYLLVMLGLTFPLPVTLMFLGNSEFGPIITGYCGCLLLGSAFVSIGLLASAIVKDQVLAFIIGLVISCFFLLMGEAFINSYFPEGIGYYLARLSLGVHFSSMGRGMVDTRDLVYFLGLIGFFLYTSVLALDSRKW
ncbi:MAG: ABC transporter permease [Candidatus Brocadiia bacterium]